MAKIRTDFITNSSSSSYIIGVKEDFTKEKLLQIFNVPESSPIYPMTEELINYILKYSELCTLEELLDNYCVTDVTELPEDYQKVISKGFKVYTGNAWDDSDGVEAVLCNMNIQYEDDEVIIYKEGGY